MDLEVPRGWVKPQRSRTLAELQELIVQKRQELAELEREAEDILTTGRLEAIARVRNLMRAHELTIEDVAAVLAEPAPRRAAGLSRERSAAAEAPSES